MSKWILFTKNLELRWMIPCLITIPITIIIALTVGCSKQQLRWTDEFAQDVDKVASGAQAVLQSPAGQMLPPGWKLYGTLGLLLTNGLIISWQEWRNRTMKKTTKAIVKGIESTSNPDKATSEVKSNIKDEMIKQGGEKFYARANKIVDRLKIA